MKAIKQMKQLTLEIQSLEKSSMLIQAYLQPNVASMLSSLKDVMPLFIGLGLGIMSCFVSMKTLLLRAFKMKAIQFIHMNFISL